MQHKITGLVFAKLHYSEHFFRIGICNPITGCNPQYGGEYGNSWKETYLHNTEEVLSRAQKELCLMDDCFMTVCFEDSKSAVQLVLRIILNKPDLEVTDVAVQKKIPNDHGRSLILDIHAKSEGVVYNCEVQNGSGDSSPRRARYHGSLLGVHSLDKGDPFSKLPETYVIFITENDKYGKGLPLYSFDRYCPALGDNLDDGSHIIYVNGKYRADDDIGYLMQDFNCTNPARMHYNELAERVKYIKSTDTGEKTMSTILDEIREMAKEEGEDKLARLMKRLLEQGRYEDASKVTSDVEFRNKLYVEEDIA